MTDKNIYVAKFIQKLCQHDNFLIWNVMNFDWFVFTCSSMTTKNVATNRFLLFASIMKNTVQNAHQQHNDIISTYCVSRLTTKPLHKTLHLIECNCHGLMSRRTNHCNAGYQKNCKYIITKLHNIANPKTADEQKIKYNNIIRTQINQSSIIIINK